MKILQQNKIIKEIDDLTKSNMTTGIEQQYLLKAQLDLEDLDKFEKIIKDLNIKLLNIENNSEIKLSPEVKMLSDELLKLYGDPNLVFRGYGQVGTWGRRDDPRASDLTIWEQFKGWSGNFIFLILFILFLSFVVPWVKKSFGQSGVEIFMVVVGIIAIILLFFTGSLKQKK
ncbi:hypothetical protein ESZ50_08755 [Weissella muntiaci]|uniref:Uncharacterized protein n=2 Tax=Weissella muntiaci TaxID=2508881 RepID=A0A6C2C385_9LACO|nr:hypothetical protein ESZ50_08755 [Weissella muntiaci]